MSHQHLPSEEIWLVREECTSGEHRYYLSNLPAEVVFEQVAGLIKARRICEQVHQQMK